MALARCSRANIEQDLRESLERLKVDYIDIYWLHRDDPARSVEDIVETMAALITTGVIRSYGVSNWTTARLDAANTYATQRGLPLFVANQPGWALADHETDAKSPSPMRYADAPMRQWHTQRNFPLVAYSSQALGFFGEENVAWARAGFTGLAPRDKGYDSAANRQRLSRAVALAQQKGCTANQIALAYLLHQPFPVYPIIGTGKPERVKEAMAAADVRFTKAECDQLSGVLALKGPCGENCRELNPEGHS